MSTPTKSTKTKPNSPANTRGGSGSSDSMFTSSLSQGAQLGVLGASIVAALGLVMAAGGFHFVGWVALSALIYSVAIYVVSRFREGPRYATDRLVTAIVSSFFLAALLPLVSLIFTVINKGRERFDSEFMTFTMKGFDQSEAVGGAAHAIQGTLIITALATLISVPIGILAAIYLVEYGGKSRLARLLTFFVDVMTGIPSIVAGLFAVAFFTLITGDPGYRAGIVGAVALSVLMIPTVVRATEEMLRIVPMELREAAYALGVPKWLTILKVVIPTAIAGIATGVTLAVARVAGETAPLLLTSGFIDNLNTNPFQDRMMTLPVLAYDQYANAATPKEVFHDRAWSAALLLIIIVMILNVVARLISKFFAPKTGR